MPKQKTVELTNPVNFTADDGKMTFYPAGVQAMPADHADHWYIQAHVKKAPPPALGDESYALALRKLADAKKAEWEDVEAQAVEGETAWQERNATLVAQRDNPEGMTPNPSDQTEDEHRAAAELDPEDTEPLPKDGKWAGDRPASDPNHPQTQGDPDGRVNPMSGIVPVGPASDPNGPEGHPILEGDERFQNFNTDNSSDQPASDPEAPEPKVPRVRPGRK